MRYERNFCKIYVREQLYMEFTKVTIKIADLKMKLMTAEPEAVLKMAASLDARISKLAQHARCPKENALVMLIMEQAEGQKRSADLIRGQQEQIFELLKKNAALSGGEIDEEIYGAMHENLMDENEALRRKIEELVEELAAIKENNG